MKCRNQIIMSVMITLVLAMFTSGTTVSEYTITPSSEFIYYHYPAPTGNQFDEVPQRQTYAYKPVQQQVARPNYVARSVSLQPIYHHQQRQYSSNNFIPIVHYPAQPPQRQQYAVYQQQQQVVQQQVVQPEIVSEQHYAAPALQQNDFTQALTHQGYQLGPSAGTAVIGRSRSSVDLQSLNVKLPLPLGLTPLNNAPLPLQSGASFDTLPRDVTSYGTKHPLKV